MRTLETTPDPCKFGVYPQVPIGNNLQDTELSEKHKTPNVDCTTCIASLMSDMGLCDYMCRGISE